jgi:hypothetical protein
MKRPRSKSPVNPRFREHEEVKRRSHSRSRSRSRGRSPARKRSKSKSKSPVRSKSRSRSRSKSKSKSPSSSRSRSRSRSPSPKKEEKEDDSELPEEALVALVQKRAEDLNLAKQRLTEFYNKKDQLKNFPYYFVQKDQKEEDNDVRLPKEQAELYTEISNLSLSIDNINNLYKSLDSYDAEVKHSINLFMYRNSGKLHVESDEYRNICRIFNEKTTSTLKSGTYLFEIPARGGFMRNQTFTMEQTSNDINSNTKVDDVIKREFPTLTTYHPNIALCRALEAGTREITIVMHKLTTPIKSISISDLCTSYSRLGVILLEHGTKITVKNNTDNLSLPVLDMFKPNQSKQSRFPTFNFIFTEISKT